MKARQPQVCRRRVERRCTLSTGFGMAERAFASPMTVAPSRTAASASVGPVPGATATLEHLWATLLHASPPPERQRLVERAAAGYVVTHPWPETAARIEFTPCLWRLDELLAGSLDGLRAAALPEPADPLEKGASRLARDLHQCPDLFLVNAAAPTDAPAPDPYAALLDWLQESLRREERVLLLTSSTVLTHPQWTAWLESEATLVVLLVDPSAPVPEGPWARCTLPRRVAQFEEHLQAERERQRAERRAALAVAAERLQAATAWPQRFVQLVAWRQQLEALQQARHGVASVVRSSLLNEAREPFLERPRRHLLAERDRHEAAYVELQTKLNAAEDHRHLRWLDVEKWRQQVEQQEQVVAQRQALRPWHPQWWLTLFQGRARQRLDEFRTRHEEAKQALQQAAEAVSAAVQLLEIETQRHAAACDQIMAEAVRARQQELDAEIAELRERIEQEERAWTDLVAGLQGADQLAPAPSVEQFGQIAELARQRLEEQQAVAAQEEAAEARAADWECWLLQQAAQVVVVVAQGSALSPPLPAAPAFDRLFILEAERRGAESLRSWLTLAPRAVLVGDAATPSPFASIYTLLQGGQINPELSWLSDTHELRCRWRSALRPDQMHVEYLVTHPDVALHIMDSDAESPTLAAVVFPAARYPITLAKSLLYEELGEVTLAPGNARPQWQRVGSDWHWHFAPAEANEVVVELEPGLREVLAVSEAGAWRTLRLEFCLAQGWTWAKIWSWLMRYLPGAALARTATLEATLPMPPDAPPKASEAGE